MDPMGVPSPAQYAHPPAEFPVYFRGRLVAEDEALREEESLELFDAVDLKNTN